MKKKYVMYVLAIVAIIVLSIIVTQFVRMAGKAATKGITGGLATKATETPTPSPRPTRAPINPSVSNAITPTPSPEALPTLTPEQEGDSVGRQKPWESVKMTAKNVAKITTFRTEVDGREDEILERLSEVLPEFNPTPATLLEVRTDGESYYAIIDKSEEERFFLLIHMDDKVSLELIFPSSDKITEIYTYGMLITRHNEKEGSDGK